MNEIEPKMVHSWHEPWPGQEPDDLNLRGADAEGYRLVLVDGHWRRTRPESSSHERRELARLAAENERLRGAVRAADRLRNGLGLIEYDEALTRLMHQYDAARAALELKP